MKRYAKPIVISMALRQLDGQTSIELASVAGGPKSIGIIIPVSDEPPHACGLADQQIGAFHVRSVTGCQDEAERPYENVN